MKTTTVLVRKTGQSVAYDIFSVITVKDGAPEEKEYLGTSALDAVDFALQDAGIFDYVATLTEKFSGAYSVVALDRS